MKIISTPAVLQYFRVDVCYSYILQNVEHRNSSLSIQYSWEIFSPGKVVLFWAAKHWIPDFQKGLKVLAKKFCITYILIQTFLYFLEIGRYINSNGKRPIAFFNRNSEYNSLNSLKKKFSSFLLETFLRWGCFFCYF